MKLPFLKPKHIVLRKVSKQGDVEIVKELQLPASGFSIEEIERLWRSLSGRNTENQK